MNGIRAKASTSPPVQVSAQQQQRHTFYQRGENVPEYTASGYQNQPQFSQAPDLYYQQLGAQPQNYDLKSLTPMLGQGVGPQPPSTMYQQQQQPPHQGMRPGNPPFFPGSNPPRQPRFATGQMNQASPQQGMYNHPVPIMYLSNTGQFAGGHQQILMNPNMLPQQRMPATQFNPGMTSTQQGLYPMHQQPTTYTQGYNNPPTFFNTSAQSQRPSSGGGQSNMGLKKERKNRLRIVDPNTGEDVAVEDVSQKMSDSGSRSTPVGSNEPQANQSASNEICAEFAAQVAMRLKPAQPPAPQQSGTPPPQMMQPPPSHPSIKPHIQQPPQHQGQGGVPIQMPSQPPGSIPKIPMQSHGVVQGNIPGMPVGVAQPNPGVMEGPKILEQDPQPQNGDIRVPAPAPVDNNSELVPNNSATNVVYSNSPSLSNQPDIVPQAAGAAPDVISVPDVVNEPQSNDKSNEEMLQQQQEVETTKDLSQVQTFVAPITDSVPGMQVESIRDSDSVDVSAGNNEKPVTDISETKDSTGAQEKADTVRQATPEVVVSPATPVEKDVSVDLDKKPEEPASESSVPKKDKAKKKARDRELNKKGEKRSNSVFDAYTDESSVTTSKAFTDSVDQDHTAENVQSDL